MLIFWSEKAIAPSTQEMRAWHAPPAFKWQRSSPQHHMIAAQQAHAAFGAPQVALERATPGKAGLLSNLLALYLHDMSDIFPVEVDIDGVFRYEKLALYWSKPDTHFPFLIYAAGHIAGFALATRGSPASDDQSDLDVAEFFVLRGHRRTGVGREAAFHLWNRVPGRWVVRVAMANSSGLSFWHRTIALYTGEQFVESRRSGTPHEWHVFTFGSVDRHG